ncbi:MAG: protein kinase, partial [Planctomycetota bacterium]|nr:protein kinase [Planctomycetota bacterium]
MVAKLVWSSESSSGAFKFADGNLHLLLNHDCLDRIQAPSTPRDGLSIELQDNGLYKFYSFGECYLFYNDKECNSIELSPKQSLQLICDDHQIDLIIDAKIAVNDPLIGTTLGGHKILERLGEGGVGVVYRAIQLDLEREVALKVLSNSAVDKGQSTVEAFKREAIAAGRMSHPGLVQVYSVGEDQGVHFFGMEVVDGGDAEEHLKSFGPFSESDAITIVLQVAEALKYASANNLIHRDIKPENLMMGSDGVKLADLGMASTRELAGDAGIGGTPHFMAPEMVSAPNSVDRRSDYYSLGCTLFRLLTAHTPFDGKSVNDILRAHRDEDAPHLSEYVEGISKGGQGLVDWLMSKDPEDRPQSADDIIHSCEELLATPNRTPLLVISAAIVTIGAIVYFGLPSSDNEPVTIEKIVIDDAAAERNAELEKELERLRLEAERNAKENQTGSNEQAVNEVPESETESKQKEIAAQAKLRADLATETSDLVERQQLSAA